MVSTHSRHSLGAEASSKNTLYRMETWYQCHENLLDRDLPIDKLATPSAKTRLITRTWNFNANSVTSYFFTALCANSAVTTVRQGLEGNVIMDVTDANVAVVHEDDRDRNGEEYIVEMKALSVWWGALGSRRVFNPPE